MGNRVDNPDIVVIGSGISGLSYAWKAAQDGRKVLILEERDRIGGCIYSCRFDDGYWYELGAHTVYNSYAGLLDIVEQAGLADRLVQRGPARVHFGLLNKGVIDWLTPPRILLRLNWLEVCMHAPLGFFRSKCNRTLEEHYSGLLGPRNFKKILSPFFAAVPSQCADTFPAEGPGSLFKKRVRRKEFPRSFGFKGGLQTLCESIAAHTNVSVRNDCTAISLSAAPDGFEIQTEQGDRIQAGGAAIAVPHGKAASILEEHYHPLAVILRRIETSSVESLGARLPKNRCRLKDNAFIVPVEDLYFSSVSRDPFPDPTWRGFAFHFRPGATYQQKLERMCDLLEVAPEDLKPTAGQNLTLPAPRVNHAEIVADIESAMTDKGFALLGNYFSGLAIEDCIARADTEWRRLYQT